MSAKKITWLVIGIIAILLMFWLLSISGEALFANPFAAITTQDIALFANPFA